MIDPPTNCPNEECDNSLGGLYEKSQFEAVDDDVWKCRQCGHLRDLR